MIIESVQWVSLGLCVVIIFVVLMNFISNKKTNMLIAEKMDSMNEYLRTLATKYAENVSFAQATNLINIASRVIKYKIYCYILDELIEEERDYKKEDMFAKIKMHAESTIREARADLGMFQYHGVYLTESIPDKIEDLMEELRPVIMRKTGNAHIKKKAQKTEIKEILCKYFDTLTLKK